MIDSKTNKQFKSTTAVDPKRVPEKMTTIPSTVISEEMIRARAYDLYEIRGRQPGQDEQDWLRAEQEIINGAYGTKAHSAGGSARNLGG